MQTQEPKQRKAESSPNRPYDANLQYFKFIFPAFEEGGG